MVCLLLSACGSGSETTFELSATVTLPAATATLEPTNEGFEERASDEEPRRAISRICMVIEEGNEENGFHLDSRQGVESIVSDYGVEAVYTQEYARAEAAGIEECLAKEASVVITNGFPWAEVTVAAADAHPEVYFIGVDHFLNDGPPNYVGIQFREDEVGFLMGYLAGMVTETNVVAGVYGVDFPPLKRFRNGYEAGVALVAQKQGREITTLGVYLDSFDDPDAGAAAAQTFIEQGADVIFGAAGTSGNGAIMHAAQQGVYVIGADQDQYYTVFEGGAAEGADKIISSALKRVNIGIFDLLSMLLEGNLAEFPGGSHYMLSTANGGVTFTNPHDTDIAAEVYDQVAEIEQLLAQRQLSTGVDPMSGDLLSEVDSLSDSISKVCLVGHEGLINDGGFFQYAYEGIQVVVGEQALESVYLEQFEDVDDPDDPQIPSLIQRCLDTGADVVITNGFFYTQAMFAAASANPKQFFIGVDQFVADGPPNYVGIQFRDDEAGFLAGYLAGLVTESQVVAGVYGPPIPPLKRFRNGYEQGLALAAQERALEIKALGAYLDSFYDPQAGADTAQSFSEAGADVIFGAGGQSGRGAILHAAAQGVYVIGVDQDEYFTTFQGGNVAGAERLISSALKRVDNGIISLLNTLVKADYENFPGGSNYILTVENGGLTFANPHQADIADQIYDQVAEVEQALASGELSTGVDPLTGELLNQ
ncbi:MAG: BMP family ABC transporter substrate-binding protein [Ardenticatenaceae bacterium]